MANLFDMQSGERLPGEDAAADLQRAPMAPEAAPGLQTVAVAGGARPRWPLPPTLAETPVEAWLQTQE